MQSAINSSGVRSSGGGSVLLPLESVCPISEMNEFRLEPISDSLVRSLDSLIIVSSMVASVGRVSSRGLLSSGPPFHSNLCPRYCSFEGFGGDDLHSVIANSFGSSTRSLRLPSRSGSLPRTVCCLRLSRANIFLHSTWLRAAYFAALDFVYFSGVEGLDRPEPAAKDEEPVPAVPLDLDAFDLVELGEVVVQIDWVSAGYTRTASGGSVRGTASC